jgi:outer membrane protein, adhesin transport system
VAVDADARKQFSAGVKSFRSNEASPVENVSGIDLGQAVTASLGFSRDVLVANARLNQAVAQTGQARAFMLPSLLVNVKAGRESSTPGAQIDTTTGREVARSVHNRQDTIVTLRQPILDVAGLYDWKRRKVIESSRQEGIRASQGDTYVATVNAYLALASTRIQANMAIDYENQLKELFQYIDKRAKAGAASNSDKERVRARMLSAKSARIEQEAAQAAAGIELVRLINLAPNSLRLPELEDVGASIVPKTLDEAMQKSLEANPDIASLRAELDAAGLDKNVAKARFLPTLNLEYSDTNSVHAGGQSGSQHDQRLMMVMNWSVLNGGSDWKLKDEKQARYMELTYRLDDQQRRVIQALSAQYATLESTRERLAGGYKELDSISSAAKSMSARMVSGNQSLLDMLDVYDRYYQARTRLVSLHIQEMTATSQIARLVQGNPNPQITNTPILGGN